MYSLKLVNPIFLTELKALESFSNFLYPHNFHINIVEYNARDNAFSEIRFNI